MDRNDSAPFQIGGTPLSCQTCVDTRDRVARGESPREVDAFAQPVSGVVLVAQVIDQ